MAIIQFKDIWEMFKIKFVIDGKPSWENFWALKGINFEIAKGEAVGIIGENGAGKSTVLKLIAEMFRPDRGEIKVEGKVSGLLELGAGFQPELTGKENIYLIAGLFGLNRVEIEEKFDRIVEFAGIGRFIHAPVKCYSQGMFVRLAFAIAIHVEPEILLIDDILAVGDEYFQRKCIGKIFEARDQGGTIIIVTHDMNMLKRLCRRAIFLKDGRVIKDDHPDKVIPLYTQAIGIKGGVEVLEDESLTAVFNNGRVFLNWQDKILTPNPGAYTAFCIGSKWYNSSQADWEVKREGGNKLVATGKFYRLTLTQTWKLELTANHEIKWDIEIIMDEPLEIQDGYVSLMLTGEYTRWFTELEKGEFPPIDERDNNWQTIFRGNNTFRACIGVGPDKEQGSLFPFLAFEQSGSSKISQAQILNADYFTNSRVLQYKTIFPQNDAARQSWHFSYFSGKIIVGIPKIGRYLEDQQQEFTLARGKMKLIFDSGRYILSYDGLNLTKNSHIGTSVYANGKWYSSDLAYWEVYKENNKLVAWGKWRELPIRQIWEAEITGENSFSWKVGMEVNETLDIPEQQIRLMCLPDYRYYFSEYGKGKFPDNFWEAEMDMLQRCVPDGAIGLRDSNDQIPALSLRLAEELNSFTKVFNSNFYNRARLLKVDRVEPEGKTRFGPGQYQCFAVELFLGKGEEASFNSEAVLENGKAKVIFNQGRGSIFWENLELTKNLGLYASLRSDKRWHDSGSSVIWKLEEKNKNTIKALGKWLHLPISQDWEIILRADNTIDFKVKLIVEKAVEFDRLQANLMLSENYSYWMAEKGQGGFPAFSRNSDDDWDSIYQGEADAVYIGVAQERTEEKYPAVKFYPSPLNSAWRLNVINSDIYHRGRVLQYLNTQKALIPAGKHHYFSGRIVVGE